MNDSIQQGIQQYNAGARFGMNSIPRHTHNNTDSPYIFQPILTYIGEVASGGTKVLLPNGWSVTRTATGVCKITHNLNSTYYQVAANANDPTIGVFCTIGTKASNSVIIKTFVPNGSSYEATNAEFGFLLTIINNRSQSLPSYT